MHAAIVNHETMDEVEQTVSDQASRYQAEYFLESSTATAENPVAITIFTRRI